MSAKEIIHKALEDWAIQPECDKLGSHEIEEATDAVLAALPDHEQKIKALEGHRDAERVSAVRAAQRLTDRWEAVVADREAQRDKAQAALELTRVALWGQGTGEQIRIKALDAVLEVLEKRA